MTNKIRIGATVRRLPVFAPVAITGTVEGISPGKVFVATSYGRAWHPDWLWEITGTRGEVEDEEHGAETVRTSWGDVELQTRKEVTE